MYKYTFALILLAFLSGCDSAASSSSDAAEEDPSMEMPAPDPAEDPAPDPTPDPADDPVTPETTGAIDTDQDFEFASTRTLFVDFDIPVTEDGYLSVCTDYSGADGVYEIDLESCPVRSPTMSGIYQGSISVTNEVSSLIGALYFYDESAQPLFREFTLVADQSRLEWD